MFQPPSNVCHTLLQQPFGGILIGGCKESKHRARVSKLLLQAGIEVVEGCTLGSQPPCHEQWLAEMDDAIFRYNEVTSVSGICWQQCFPRAVGAFHGLVQDQGHCELEIRQVSPTGTTEHNPQPLVQTCAPSALPSATLAGAELGPCQAMNCLQ